MVQRSEVNIAVIDDDLDTDERTALPGPIEVIATSRWTIIATSRWTIIELQDRKDQGKCRKLAAGTSVAVTL